MKEGVMRGGEKVPRRARAVKGKKDPVYYVRPQGVVARPPVAVFVDYSWREVVAVKRGMGLARRR